MYCALGLLPKWREGKKNKEKRKKKKGEGNSVCKHRVLGAEGTQWGPNRALVLWDKGAAPVCKCQWRDGSAPCVEPKSFWGRRFGRKEDSALPRGCARSPGILPGVETAKSIAAIMCTGKKKQALGLGAWVAGGTSECPRRGLFGPDCQSPPALGSTAPLGGHPLASLLGLALAKP